MKTYTAHLIQAEEGEDFQDYYDDSGKRIPSGEDVGVEVTQFGETRLYLLDDVNLP